MITATEMIAISAKPMISGRFGDERKPPRAVGARLTMPAKMMKLMPLPMPFSVISLPSHIRVSEPAVSVMIWVIVKKFERSNPLDSTRCVFRRARKPYDWRSAIGTARYRAYWLILFRPYSTYRWRAWRDGITPVISCMMIEALMYGLTPNATTEKLDSPPPDSRS